MNTNNPIVIWRYADVLLRRKWLIIWPFSLISSLALVLCLLLPNIFRAKTVILVQPQRVPEAYVHSTVTSPISDRLRTISQQLLSRTVLEKMINELDLYSEDRKTLTIEEVVEKMRKNIELKVRGNDSFELFYQGIDPKVVAIVTNKLASLFIEENLKVREEHADGTTEFLERELDRIRNELEAQEKAVKDFKFRFMGELPGQLDGNLRALDRLQIQIQANSEALSAAEDRRGLLQKQLSELEQGFAASGNETLKEGTVSMVPQSQLGTLKEKLRNLQNIYTDKHPEVVKLKNEIQLLETRVQGKGKENQKEGIVPVEFATLNPFYEELKGQLAAVNLRIKNLKDDKIRLNDDFIKYQKRVDNTPGREQELILLTRDYDNIKGSYQSLLNKKLEAQLSANMERKQKGEQFKILDSARIPEKPFKPDRRKIVFLGLILGLSIGVGLAFAMEYLEHSFRDVKELEEITKLPVLATIPRIFTKQEIKRKAMKRKVAFVSSMGVFVLLITVAAVHLFLFRLDFLMDQLLYVRNVLQP